MIGFTLRLISTFTGNLLNTMVIIGLFCAYYMNTHANQLDSFDKQAAFSQISQIIEGAPKGRPGKSQKVAQKTSAPKIINIR